MRVALAIWVVSGAVLMFGLGMMFAEGRDSQPTVLPPGIAETVEAAGVATAEADGVAWY